MKITLKSARCCLSDAIGRCAASVLAVVGFGMIPMGIARVQSSDWPIPLMGGDVMEFTDEQILRMGYADRWDHWRSECDQLWRLPWDQREAAVESLRRKWRV